MNLQKNELRGQLKLPVPDMKQVKSFMPGNFRRAKDDIRGGLELQDGTLFAFENGHVFAYEGPNSFFSLQDPSLIPDFYGPVNMTQQEAVEMARSAIGKLRYPLAHVLADLEPSVPPLEHARTNVIPRYRIKWLDPRSGGAATEVEINAMKKSIDRIRFNNIVALKRPPPKVTVEPAPLDPANSWMRLWIRQNDWANYINHEYAYRLVPVVFQAAEDWARRFNFELSLPISSNQVRRFYCSNNGGVPYVEMTLTNNWQFTYRVNQITYAGSPRRFFESDELPFRVKDFAGKWNLTEDQAIELSRQTVAKLGFPLESLHVVEKPSVRRPKGIEGMPTIPRLWLEWRHPTNPAMAVEQWIEVEVDCDRGTIEMLHFDDVRLWDKAPDLGVPIDPERK